MWLWRFFEVPTSLLLILLNFSASYPNLFMPLLLIPLQTSRKAASLGGLCFTMAGFLLHRGLQRGGGLFWLCSVGGGGGGGHLGGDGDGDAAMPWNASSSSSASSSSIAL